MKVKSAQFGFTTPLVIAATGLVVVILGVVVYFLPSPKSKPTSQSQQTPPPRETSSFILQSPTATSTASPSETANWQLYRNEKDKYEIKYPEHWRKEFIPTDNPILGDSTILSKKTAEISFFTGPLGFSGSPSDKLEKLVVGNRNVEFVFQEYSESRFRVVNNEVIKAGFDLNIVISIEKATYKKDLEEIKLILSTFKSLD